MPHHGVVYSVAEMNAIVDPAVGDTVYLDKAGDPAASGWYERRNRQWNKIEKGP
jgi:hypothetical protein